MNPRSGDWTPSEAVELVLAMMDAKASDDQFGPFELVCTPDWKTVMESEYPDLGGTSRPMTLRDRLQSIEGINAVHLTADMLPGDFRMELK